MIGLLKLPIFIFMWMLVLAVKIPTALSGFLIVPFLYRYRNTHYDDLPTWTLPWANPEDWEGCLRTDRDSLPHWWIEREGSSLKSFYHYHAVRNPANGLRSFEWLDMDIDPDKVKYITNMKVGRAEPSDLRAQNKKTGYYLAWQGFRAGFKIMHMWSEDRHLVIKFGWRVEPRYTVDKIPDIFLEDASFASKILLYRKG